MDVSTFTRLFPRLYHLTFAANLPGIRQHGLCSAQSLADLHSFTPEERAGTLTSRRRCIQSLHGVTIRDQHAAPESKMKSCLVKITISEWFALLSSKTFFFLSSERAGRFAESYGSYENALLEVDTAALLATHAGVASLCKLISGDFLNSPRPRGRASFIPFADYAYKNKRDTPAELTVDTPIPNIFGFASQIALSL
jgi:hypothetical protein